MTERPDTITVIGAHWCPDCRRAKAFLSAQRVPFAWVDLEEHPEEIALVEELNGGSRTIPTILFPDGSHLSEPGNDELADKLGLTRSARFSTYDVIIVGGGPTGLTTALYLARENLRALVIERSAPGGQAGITERLDNYPGFPDGVAGFELADRMRLQAERYGVEILEAVAVVALRPSEGWIEVETSLGATYQARAALIATGSTYRRTGAMGEEDLIGAGVHFCATCDGPFYKGAKEVAVIGGGNSGLEEGLFLTQFADHVTVLERGPELAGSRLLRDKVLAHPKMSVVTNVEVTAFHAGENGKLASIEVRDRSSNERGVRAASGAFVFIGLDPNTEFVRDLVALDDRGFILTDEQLRTSVPGVFAAGDVRQGSTKQLASAVGEGAAVALQIRYHLDKLGAAVE